MLDFSGPDDDVRVQLEREGVRRTEHDPSLGGISDEFQDLSRAHGPLKDAILALPYGNASHYYAEPGYFANVRSSTAAFDFVVRHLDARPAETLLDIGADLTWSTAYMARRGLACVALDINHHLAVGRLFHDSFGISYDLVRADMRTVAFRPRTFDIVLAINALHHTDRIKAVAVNVARMLRNGGRLGFIEPYCDSEAAKAAFGQAQIAAGISEQTYLLTEWHAALTEAGLRVRVHRVSDSFAAVYEKTGDAPDAGDAPALLAGFYRGDVRLAGPAAVRVATGETIEVPLILRNRGNGVWCPTSQFPVYASYHLRQADGALLAFDNPRTALTGEIHPGETATVNLQITAPCEPGDYLAEIDLVHEYVSWFAPGGMSSPTVRIHVTGPPA